MFAPGFSRNLLRLYHLGCKFQEVLQMTKLATAFASVLSAWNTVASLVVHTNDRKLSLEGRARQSNTLQGCRRSGKSFLVRLRGRISVG
jgi:hypothetical protein